jgi:hypothetical protein
MTRPARYAEICLQPHHLTRTLAIALVVGTWLTAFNHGEVLMYAEASGGLWVKVLLNYLTPFVVSNWGLVSRRTAEE